VTDSPLLSGPLWIYLMVIGVVRAIALFATLMSDLGGNAFPARASSVGG
jgi:hypothetical protein